MPPQPNFDRIARPYRLLEYLTLGRALERCRFHFLPHLRTLAPTRILALGDGDGRFLARLLQQNPQAQADAVDTSATMLSLLTARCQTTGIASNRLETHQTSALAFTQSTPAAPYDLIVTHFFLDCLTQPELNQLATQLRPVLTPGALWLLSDFRIPTGPAALLAKLLVRTLYLAFRTLTGLRTSTLPDHETTLTQAGFTRLNQHLSLAGILTTELWSAPAPASASAVTHPR